MDIIERLKVNKTRFKLQTVMIISSGELDFRSISCNFAPQFSIQAYICVGWLVGYHLAHTINIRMNNARAAKAER